MNFENNQKRMFNQDDTKNLPARRFCRQGLTDRF